MIQPGTGKAVEVRAGQILRIEQVEGGQCVDFNCFNLNDYKEFMHCGRTRTVHGFHPIQRHVPLVRAAARAGHDVHPGGHLGRNDVLFPRCSAYLYESAYGFDVHTNCQDIQAEAQREYGLTPDDVHDSFNLFMCTEMSGPQRAEITRQTSQAGDYVDLLALMDVLAVTNVCGADVMRTSNFALKPIRLSLRQATAAEMAAAPPTPVLRSQRSPESFRVRNIKADRELRADPAYQPEFRNVPMTAEDVSVELSAAEMAMLTAVRQPVYGDDDGAALRDVFFSWWEERFLPAAAARQ